MLAQLNSHRVVGFTAPDRTEGAGRAARALASLHARCGAKTLLVELVNAPSQGRGWVPGADPEPFIEARGGVDVLVSTLAAEQASAPRSVRQLRESFGRLTRYEAIVVFLPIIGDAANGSLDSLIAAGACDAVVIVCQKDVTSITKVERAIELFRTANINVAGTLFDEFN